MTVLILIYKRGSFTTTLANTIYGTAKSVLGIATLTALPYTHGGVYSSPELQGFVRKLLDARGWGDYASSHEKGINSRSHHPHLGAPRNKNQVSISVLS